MHLSSVERARTVLVELVKDSFDFLMPNELVGGEPVLVLSVLRIALIHPLDDRLLRERGGFIQLDNFLFSPVLVGRGVNCSVVHRSYLLGIIIE